MEEEIMLLAEENPISDFVGKFNLYFTGRIFSFVTETLDKFDALQWALGILTLYSIYRFLLAPIFSGSAGSSDRVKKDKKGK